MKTYKFEITIKEGYDEFWESISGSGCQEITEALEEALRYSGFDVSFDAKVRLKEFKDEE